MMMHSLKPRAPRRITVARQHSVPPFPPMLPDDGILMHDGPSRDMLLSKRTWMHPPPRSSPSDSESLTGPAVAPPFHSVIHAERASYEAPAIAPKLARTRAALLSEVIHQYSPHA